jgi:hypothetical protein
MNYCIDFLPYSGPYSAYKWAMLYVFGIKFNKGYYISVN